MIVLLLSVFASKPSFIHQLHEASSDGSVAQRLGLLAVQLTRLQGVGPWPEPLQVVLSVIPCKKCGGDGGLSEPRTWAIAGRLAVPKVAAAFHYGVILSAMG